MELREVEMSSYLENRRFFEGWARLTFVGIWVLMDVCGLDSFMDIKLNVGN